MKFSGRGPGIHAVLAGLTDPDGELYEIYNDKAAAFPWPKGSAQEPQEGQGCASCPTVFNANQMVYLTIETDKWVCWRHIQGLTEPATVVMEDLEGDIDK